MTFQEKNITKSEKETDASQGLVSGRHPCFVSSEQAGHSVREAGQHRDVTQTPEDLRKRREMKWRKKMRKQERENKEEGREKYSRNLIQTQSFT